MSSRPVHADPEALREFAAHVSDFGVKVSGEIDRLRAHFDRLDWRDAQRQRFADELADMATRIRIFQDMADDIASKLRQKAQPLEVYHGAHHS